MLNPICYLKSIFKIFIAYHKYIPCIEFPLYKIILEIVELFSLKYFTILVCIYPSLIVLSIVIWFIKVEIQYTVLILYLFWLVYYELNGEIY